MKLVPWAAVIATVLVGCGSDSPENRGKLSTIQREIFTPTCATAGCHLGSAATASSNGPGLDLTANNSYAALVNVNAVNTTGKRVVPGDRNASVLYKSITTGATRSGIMPSGGRPLSQADIDAIGAWIDAGALNN